MYIKTYSTVFLLFTENIYFLMLMKSLFFFDILLKILFLKNNLFLNLIFG